MPARTAETTPTLPRMIAGWEPAIGTLVVYPFRLPGKLVADLAEEAPLFVLVNDDDQYAARARLTALGVAPSRWTLVPATVRSPWTRDWGPHQVVLPDGRTALVDHVFRGYPWVPAQSTPDDYTYRWAIAGEDDAVAAIGEALHIPVITLPAIATGGNLLTDGHGRAFCTEAQVIENTPIADESTYRDLLRAHLGITELVVLENTEPFGIQHIDCWLKVIDAETLLVKRAPEDHPEYAPIERNIERLRKLKTPGGGYYRIVRIDCPPFRENHLPAYTNAFRLNDVMYVPLFDVKESDEAALATYRSVLPDCEVRGYLFDGWQHFDALHCRTRALHAKPRRQSDDD